MTDTGAGAIARPGAFRWPFYYGWVNLGMAALAMVGTLPGARRDSASSPSRC